MLPRLATHLLLRPEDVSPSRSDWEVIGAFNPGVIRRGDETLLLVRVAERPRESRPGFTALPRWSAEEGFVVDWLANDELELLDPRVVRRRADGIVRLTFVSHLRLAISRGGRRIDRITGPIFTPQQAWEEFGVEDPRITFIDGRYYITYVAVSRHGAATALASTTEFNSYERHGIIFHPENKDVVLFPERIAGNYVALHRPRGGTDFTTPEIWTARSPDLFHWGAHLPLFGGAGPWETGRVGAGAPPLPLPEGWLEIYHGNRRPDARGDVGAYCGAAMLLAGDDPSRILKVSREPILQPETDFELEGFVAKVVFPTAVLEEEDRLLVYYGASDKYCAMAEVPRQELLESLNSM